MPVITICAQKTLTVRRRGLRALIAWMHGAHWQTYQAMFAASATVEFTKPRADLPDPDICLFVDDSGRVIAEVFAPYPCKLNHTHLREVSQ